MKLESKHLIPYLLYKLRLKEKNWNYIYLMVGITFSHIYATEIGDDEIFDIDILEQNIKPILHPLSDLTKEIEHNGERFTPIKLIQLFIDPNFPYSHDGEESWEVFYQSANDTWQIDKNCSYKVIEKLFEWHFDVFGLIDQGLAIDINTLKI